MYTTNKLFIISLLASTFLVSSNSFAGNGSITVTGTQGSNYVASDNVSGSSFDTFTANSSTATFNKNLTVNKNKEVKDSILNFSGNTVSGDVIGLERGYNGKTTKSNTINITGGTINGNVLGTSDKASYNGTDRRDSNNINFSGGGIGGNIEGGAGAANNVITVTGGTLQKTNDGHSHDDDYCDGNSGVGNDDGSSGSCVSGTIYAGVSDAKTKNKSTDGTVILKNMTDSNSFLSSFTQGTDGLSGMIFGSNLTGTSNMRFENVDGTYKGGFKNFDNVLIDSNSTLVLGGNSYYADNWQVDGSLNTNGKVAHAYKSSTLNLSVSSAGLLTQQFLSDANVNAVNAGTINGIKTDKNITLNNSGKMTGEYAGSTVNINNSGIINSVAGQSTTISSTNPGILNNTGQIKETVSFIGQTTVNNNTGGSIDALIINAQNTLNINNTGTIDSTTIANLNSTKTTNINNNSGGVIQNGLTLKNGTLNLNNLSGANLTGNPFVTDAGIFNINNSGNITGNSSLSATNGGTFNFINNSTGNVTGGLTINSGLNTFTNNGTFNNLGITNNQVGVVLNNNKDITGTGSILSNSTFLLNNNSGGNITGNQTWKNVNLDNKIGGTVSNLALTSNAGTVNIGNNGTISGNNSIFSSGGGTTNLSNNTNGNLTGNLVVNGGLNNFNNAGNLHDLTTTNNQGTINLTNSGIMQGVNQFNNADDTKIVNITNTANGITGTLGVKEGTLNLTNNSTAIIQNATFNSDSATLNIDNKGIINGNNSINGSNTGVVNLVNDTTGNLSGILNINSGLHNFSNAGNIHDLTLNNQISNLAFSNTGTYSGNNVFNATNGGTLLFNNDAGGLITGNMTVNSGLDNINNNAGGVINDLTLTANQDDFTITNNGNITGNNTLTANNEFKIINEGAGEVNSNLTINAPITTLEQKSTGGFLANLYGSSSTNTLNLINSTVFNSSLNGSMGTVNLTNDNTTNSASTMALTNNGTIYNNINVDNDGYTTINNNGTILAALSDATSPVVGDTDCPESTLELNNSGNISGDMSVLNNIFKFNNTATGNVTSDKIDTRDLRLTNAGSIYSANNYAFSVRGNVEATNAASGIIYGKDYAFKLLGKPEAGSDVKGFINNSGTIYSQGTTIGYDQSDIPCPNCYGSDLVINNYGKIVSVDVATLTNPDLNSHAISAENAVVNNYAGGLIGGSAHVKEYNQKSGATWVTFLDKDLSQMSTIIAEDKISIENGSILTIYTNNDVKAFTGNQEFKLVEAKGMTQDAIDAQIENFTIRTDSPFANYQMIGKNTDEGYIVFNHVAPTTYASATDLATASHNSTILGSQRMYELFVNRDVNQPQGRSGGDSTASLATNTLNFMPMGGYAHQGDKDGHAGYNSAYYGGITYFEHDFNNNFKGGLGFAYMNNNTDFNDADDSDGKMDSYRPFAYVNYENTSWRVDLAGGVAKHKVDNTRKYSFNDVKYSAKGKYDADEFSGHLNIGYKIALANDVLLQPMIGAYAAKLKTDAFNETGSGPMNMHVKSEDYNSFKSMIGFKIKKEYAVKNGMIVTPEFHARWYHELGDTKGGVSAFFLAQEQLFNTSGIESPKDVGDIAFRLTTKTGSNFDLFTETYYQFGSQFYNAGGTVGLQYNF